jgi:hypothetical protein
MGLEEIKNPKNPAGRVKSSGKSQCGRITDSIEPVDLFG